MTELTVRNESDLPPVFAILYASRVFSWREEGTAEIECSEEMVLAAKRYKVIRRGYEVVIREAKP